MTDHRVTQVSIEEWAAPPPPRAQVTQVAVEMWANVAANANAMVVTIAAVEEWASVGTGGTGGLAWATVLA